MKLYFQRDKWITRFKNIVHTLILFDLAAPSVDFYWYFLSGGYRETGPPVANNQYVLEELRSRRCKEIVNLQGAYTIFFGWL